MSGPTEPVGALAVREPPAGSTRHRIALAVVRAPLAPIQVAGWLFDVGSPPSWHDFLWDPPLNKHHSAWIGLFICGVTAVCSPVWVPVGVVYRVYRAARSRAALGGLAGRFRRWLFGTTPL